MARGEPQARNAGRRDERRIVKPGPRDGFRWNRETIVYAFELWNRRHLCSPTVDEWRRAGPDHPSVSTVRHVFGSWNRGVKAAGLRPRKPGEARRGDTPALAPRESTLVRWSHNATIEAMRRWHEAHGHQPSLEQWRRADRSHPSAATVRRLFGTWNTAVAEAGFEPRRASGSLRTATA
jgi:hypothetical protein